MNPLFPPELRTAAVVKRWSIVRTLADDLVSSHSYFVTFYALQIARLINWPGPYADLTFAAMMHDTEEFITGDLPSPIKREIIDDGKYTNYVSTQMKLRMPLVEAQLEVIMESPWAGSIDRIIKVADKVDAVIFLITEQRMGNVVLEPLYQDAVKNLSAAWAGLGEELYGEDEMELPSPPAFEWQSKSAQWRAHRAAWDNDVWPAIQAHWKNGSVGIQ